MLILTIRTDKPEAEIGLFEDAKKLSYKQWPAHRQLAETIHTQIAKILQSQEKTWNGLEGLVCYKGPGSFTGLRIGLTVANTLAYSLKVPIVSGTGKQWIKQGNVRLAKGENESVSLPEYGSPANITKPKK